MSIFCSSKSCPFVSSSINELVEHIKQAHSFTCSIPQCGYSAKCLCKVAEHVQAVHSNYQPISLNSSRLLRKYLLPISANVDIAEQREYMDMEEEEKEEEEEESYSLLAKMKEVKKNDPSLVLSNSTKIRKW
ncbi:unnamed protein product [Blepharisma stoltei]|uniref:C2H2-type domain-containing protein n=1 Tax=Blepharisma stoltei TaxID=1481888 RepID=A0AAU9JPS7_9CILI|nr:unnamed protein product [Blepharisma stoltei]